MILIILTLARLESYTVVYVIAIIEWKQAQVAWGAVTALRSCDEAATKMINERESYLPILLNEQTMADQIQG